MQAIFFMPILIGHDCLNNISIQISKMNDNQALRSVFKASYLQGFNNPNALNKSKIPIDKAEQQNIDDKTFKIMPNFVKPKDDFVIHKKSARCYLQEEGFFLCCVKGRKTYDMRLVNSKLSISSGENIVRFVDFNVVWANVNEIQKGFIITFQHSATKIYVELVKSSEEQVKEWVRLLKQIIKTTDAKNKQYTFFIKKKQLDFYRTQQVLNEQFEKCANSLDIILFKSQHSAATVQRLFTNSEYDHVGVVLRNKKNQLFIYESTSDSGVGFTAWRHFVRYEWFESIDKVVWRPLQIQLTNKDIQTIEAFVVKTLGKQFQINLEKLLQNKSTLKRQVNVEESKTYFCSELVARLYKELGILDSEKASTTYYPVDFSQQGFLKIVRSNVGLKNQRLISFDKSSK